MKFAGRIDVPAPRAAVFKKLRDARFFASCVDGVEELSEIDDRHYTATLATKVAYLSVRFPVALWTAASGDPVRVVAKVEAPPLGMVGRLTATSAADLVEQDGGTAVN